MPTSVRSVGAWHRPLLKTIIVAAEYGNVVTTGGDTWLGGINLGFVLKDVAVCR
jgi:hypothetical protein